MTQRHRSLARTKDFEMRLGYTLFDVDDENKNKTKKDTKTNRHTNF